MGEARLRLFEGYGIELEYMIVDRQSLSILPITDKVIHAVSGTYESEIEMGPLNWSNELVLHVIELKTNGPAPSLEPLPKFFDSHVRRINEILAPLNARLMPTAMHPWMDPLTETHLWQHEYNAVYESYNRIFGCTGHGWSNLQSLHMNLPFDGDEEFGRLHAAIRLVLPLIPAIAAASPIYESKISHFRDSRLEFYRNNQTKIPSLAGRIIPEPLYTEREYEEKLLKRLYADISPYDPDRILQFEWLNSRGAIARFDRNTIEIRVIDIQECPLADISIAAAISLLLKALIGEVFAPLEKQKHFPTELLAEILLGTIRNGEDAVVDNPEYLKLFGRDEGPACTAGELWSHLYDTHLRNGMADIWRTPFEIILNRGTLSTRIVNYLNNDFSRDKIKECYRILMDCLAEGRLFIG